jgi:ActR/RegA family two-component response regulator
MSTHRLRLLLLDDDEDLVETVALVLRRAPDLDLDVVPATTVEHALRLLHASRFDVVISDYRVSGRSGLEVLAAAARDHPNARRLLLTGYAPDGLPPEARPGGTVHAILAKDDLLRNLAARLRKILGLEGSP